MCLKRTLKDVNRYVIWHINKKLGQLCPYPPTKFPQTQKHPLTISNNSTERFNKQLSPREHKYNLIDVYFYEIIVKKL